MRSLLCTLFLGFVTLSGPSNASAPPALAVVGGEKVMPADVDEAFVRRHGGHQKFLAGEQEVRRFLEIVIDDRLLLQEARTLELESTPEIRQSVEAFADKKAKARLLELEIEQPSKPKPDEVRAAIRAHTILTYQTQELLVGSREEAEALYLKVLAGEPFEVLARECSIAPSRRRGGHVAPTGWGTMTPEWEEAVFALSPGETSPPFETREGFQVVRLLDVQSIAPAGEAKAYARVEGILKKRATEVRKRDLSRRLFAEYGAKAGLPEQGATGSTEVATWRGGRLTLAEFMAGLDMASLSQLPQGRQRAALESALRDAVDGRLQLLAGRDRGLAKTPPISDEVRRHEDDLVLGALYENHVLKGIEVTDAEIRAEYETRKADYMNPERRRMAHIVLPSAEAAQAARKRLDAGESFGDLAKELSSDKATAKDGGDLGWITKRDVPSELTAVLALATGEVSQPLATKFGFHLMKVTAIEPATEQSLDEARPQLQKRLLEKKRAAARVEWVKKLRAASKVTISEAGIRAYVKEQEEKAR